MKYIDIAGLRVGRLTAICPTGEKKKSGHAVWLARCDCGGEKRVNGTRFKRGDIVSCGCIRGEWHRGRTGRYSPAFKHGDSTTPEYRSWAGMRKRCYDQNYPGYKYYGARNITVCERWRNSYEAFLSDMGRKPSPGHSLDRIDNDGNYHPDNCRWATRSEQNRNKRKGQYGPNNRTWSCVGRPITINGVMYRSLTNACKALNFSRQMAMRKLGHGKSPDESFGVVQ